MEIKFDISFTLKWHYCHIGCVGHNLQLTYLYLNYAGHAIKVSQQGKHLWSEITKIVNFFASVRSSKR